MVHEHQVPEESIVPTQTAESLGKGKNVAGETAPNGQKLLAQAKSKTVTGNALDNEDPPKFEKFRFPCFPSSEEEDEDPSPLMPSWESLQAQLDEFKKSQKRKRGESE
jgi:hypothetical protein